jgi:hypothetical protein
MAGNLVKNRAQVFLCKSCGKYTTQSGLTKGLRFRERAIPKNAQALVPYKSISRLVPPGARLGISPHLIKSLDTKGTMFRVSTDLLRRLGHNGRMADVAFCLRLVASGLSYQEVAKFLSSRGVEKMRRTTGAPVLLTGVMPPGFRPGWTLDRWEEAVEENRQRNEALLAKSFKVITDKAQYRMWKRRIIRMIARAVQYPEDTIRLLQHEPILTERRIRRNIVLRYAKLAQRI